VYDYDKLSRLLKEEYKTAQEAVHMSNDDKTGNENESDGKYCEGTSCDCGPAMKEMMSVCRESERRDKDS